MEDIERCGNIWPKWPPRPHMGLDLGMLVNPAGAVAGGLAGPQGPAGQLGMTR